MGRLIFLLVVCALAGSGLLVAGVYVLVGLGWSLLSAGALFMLAAALFRNGLATHVE